MTGLNRWVLALIGLPIVAGSALVTVVLVGALNFCGFDENVGLAGYCGASSDLRMALLGIPCATVLSGYLLTFLRGELSPVLLAAAIAFDEGLIELTLGY